MIMKMMCDFHHVTFVCVFTWKLGSKDGKT